MPPPRANAGAAWLIVVSSPMAIRANFMISLLASRSICAAADNFYIAYRTDLSAAGVPLSGRSGHAPARGFERLGHSRQRLFRNPAAQPVSCSAIFRFAAREA